MTKILENVHVCKTSVVPNVTNVSQDIMVILHVSLVNVTTLVHMEGHADHLMANAAVGHSIKEDSVTSASLDFTDFQTVKSANVTQLVLNLKRMESTAVQQVT